VNKVRLEVYLLNLSYFVYVETASMDVSVRAAGQHTLAQMWALISNIGGIIGMAAGMSVFSIVELVFTFLQIILVLVTGHM
jgi:hypothetical protein